MLEEVENYPYVGHVLRKVSPYFTKFFIETKVSANQVSLFSIVSGVVGGLLFVFGDYYLMLVGCIVFLQLWNFFDCVDGEVARVMNDISLGGRYLEEVHNPIVEPSFIACFGIGLFKLWGSLVFLYLGFFFALSICLLHNFNSSRYYISEQVEKKEAYVFPLTRKKAFSGILYRKIYRKIRLLFLLPNTYLILTGILIFEILSPIKISYSLYGVNLNLLSAYFFLYGVDWLVRTCVSGATNYRYLKHLEKEKVGSLG
jgi:phosphatidylglycerophosphate synthase